MVKKLLIRIIEAKKILQRFRFLKIRYISIAKSKHFLHNISNLIP